MACTLASSPALFCCSLAAVVLVVEAGALGCDKPSPGPAPTASSPRSAEPSASVAGPGTAASAPGDASAPAPSDSPSFAAPDSAPPQLPPWPASSQLTRQHDGKPFLVGVLKVQTTLFGQQVSDERAAYVELADGQLEGVVEDQRRLARKVVGELRADGSFELRQAGQSAPMVTGTKQGDEVKGELLVSVWGEGTGYAPKLQRPAFVLDRTPRSRQLVGNLLGMVGTEAVRVKLATGPDGFTGEARDSRGPERTLRGRYDSSTERLVLDEARGTEALGELRVALFGTAGPAFGVWRSADGTRSAFVALREAMGPMPAPVALGSTLRLEPQFVLYFGRSCVFDHTWPVLVGQGTDVARLNRELGAWSREGLAAPICNEESLGPMSERTFYELGDYDVHPVGGGRFGIELGHWSDGNGAHGLGSKRCLLVDPAAGRVVEPCRLLAESKRAELTALVTKKLLAANRVKSMAELRKAAGGSEEGPDDAPVSPETDLCLTERGLDVAFEVYEIGPYSMNAPTVSLTRAEARPFFAADELMSEALK